MYSRCGEYVRKWIEAMAEDWDFKQIVPAHFAAPIPCTGRELVAAFQRSTDVYEPFVPQGDAAGDSEVGKGAPAGGAATSNPGTQSQPAPASVATKVFHPVFVSPRVLCM